MQYPIWWFVYSNCIFLSTYMNISNGIFQNERNIQCSCRLLSNSIFLSFLGKNMIVSSSSMEDMLVCYIISCTKIAFWGVSGTIHWNWVYPIVYSTDNLHMLSVWFGCSMIFWLEATETGNSVIKNVGAFRHRSPRFIYSKHHLTMFDSSRLILIDTLRLSTKFGLLIHWT